MPVSLNDLSWHHPATKKLPFTGLFFTALVISMLLYNLKEPVSIPLIKLPFAGAILASCFLLQKPLFHPLFWATWLAWYIFLLANDYYGMANHHFVTCYLLIAIILYTSSGRKEDQVLRFHIRFILMFVLLASSLHKLLSPSFTNGSFFQFEMYTDIFLRPLKWVVPGWDAAIRDNLAAYKQLKSHHPSMYNPVMLKEPIRYAAIIAKSGSWFAIIMEALAGMAMFAKSHHRISHLLFLTMVAGVFFFRLETGFLSLLSCMGLLLAPSNTWKNIWLGCFILFAAMVATGAGIR